MIDEDFCPKRDQQRPPKRRGAYQTQLPKRRPNNRPSALNTAWYRIVVEREHERRFSIAA